MRNSELAGELITKYAAVPHPLRGMIQEAARRLLQMAPENEVTVPQEAKWLREMAVEWPLKEKPWSPPDWNIDDQVRGLCNAAANRIEQMAETIAYARQIKAERDAAMADIQRCCATCALCSRNNGTGEMCPWYDDCNQVDGDHWEWRGAKDINVPGKKEE